MNPNPVDGLPHDIHGLVPYEPTLLDRWPWLVAGAVALVALALAWHWWRRRRGAARPAAPIDPWDALEARLAALLPPEPFAGRAREGYFYELSLGLREAVERRTALRATDMTSGELREPLRRKLPLPPAEIDAMLAFLLRADMVKFAEAEASRDEALAAAQHVRRWVGALRPRAEAAAEPGQGGAGDGRRPPGVVGLPSEQAGVAGSTAGAASRKSRLTRQSTSTRSLGRGPT